MQTSKLLVISLWTVQVVLALFFALASGAPKLLIPVETLPMPIPLPALFVKLIGVCEVLGALGLVLPSVLRIRPGLTPLAAACLTLLTVCAAFYQVAAGQAGNSVFALGFGALAAFVAYGRWRLAPIHNVSRQPALAAAS